jgi:hypothetical protein
MKVKELRRAYATLGLADNATLTEARDAYLTWVGLLGDAFVEPGTEDQFVPLDLLHHELDLAWHAIEQAHQFGLVFPRQVRGCEECAGSPAVRIKLHRVEPGGFGPRVRTTEALLCRDCGLRACRRTQLVTLRRGWWGVLAPFANLRAMSKNSTERAFLSRLEPAVPRALPGSGPLLQVPSELPAGRRTEIPAQPTRARRGPVRAAAKTPAAAVRGRRPTAPPVEPERRRRPARNWALPWLAGLAAIAVTVGIALPSGSPAGSAGTGAQTSTVSSAAAHPGQATKSK